MTTQNNITIWLRSPVLFLLLVASCLAKPLVAQDTTDSLIINVGKSQIIFLVRDKEDLERLSNYDLNQILEELSLQLNDDSTFTDPNAGILADTTIVVNEPAEEIEEHEEEEDYDEVRYVRYRQRDRRDEDNERRRRRSTYHFFNFELGTNNYLENGKFPDENNALYSVRPWGSWYVGLVSVNQTNISGPFFIEWGPSVTWYNFKFENDAVRVIEGDVIDFQEDNSATDPIKSKLTVAYVNFSVVPMFFANDHINGRARDWFEKRGDRDGFRFGVGGYVGYRIASYTKTVIRQDGDKEKSRDKDSFNLTNVRYGLRAQIGFRGTDLFFNYDLNELFNNGGGPELNAFSIGLTF